jgi:penicillin-insensitive murein endopeptidase
VKSALYAAVLLGALSSTACLGMPSPLAPTLQGSVGVPNGGVLTEGAELPREGEGFRRFRPTSDSHHAQPGLVAAIVRAAASVARERPGGSPLVVGDLSGPRGGRIPRHASHRTGRDVDFLLYVTTPSGAPITSPGFIPLGPDGLAQLEDGRYIRLDVERQWLFFKALLQDPDIDVQFLFINRALEALIIDYALARETNLELVWHAQTVMMQPGDSLPHADHVHMRIACRPDEAVRGCLGGGPHWEWLTPLPSLSTPLDELWAQIAVDDPFDLPPLAAPLEPAVVASLGGDAQLPPEATGSAKLGVSPLAPVAPGFGAPAAAPGPTERAGDGAAASAAKTDDQGT